MKYHLVALGCQMNISDTERVVTILNKMGMERTEEESEAQVLGVVACSVRQNAINKVYSRIHKWNKWKQTKNILTFVSGCILPADRVKFLKIFDLVFPMSELQELPEMISQYGMATPFSMAAPSEKTMHNDTDIHAFWKITPNYDSSFEAFVPIQNGCNKFCSFCAVPYTRGREVSRPSQEVISEIDFLLDKGYKSITLLGQNVNSYGLDKSGNEITFSQLLQKIGELGNQRKQQFWTYFTSPHPRDMKEEVIDVIASYPQLAKMIHLPMQSGDDRMLIRMNRNHRLDEYRQIVHYIRKKLPEATLFTDIITGFSQESEDQFLNTQRAMEEFKFNMAYIAKYSPRPGALSSRWEDDIPQETKKARLHALTETLAKISQEYNQNLPGKTIPVLVTGYDRNSSFLTGYSEGKIIVRLNHGSQDMIGKFINVKITEAASFSVAGDPML